MNMELMSYLRENDYTFLGFKSGKIEIKKLQMV